MERTGYFSIHGDEERLANIEKVIKDEAIKYSIDDGRRITVLINEKSPAFDFLQETMQEEHRPYDSFHESRKYTKKEISEGQYYELYLANPWELDGKSESNFNVDYDMSNACPECGRGKKLCSDLYAQISKLKKKNIVSLDPSIIVSKQVKEIIEDYKLTGCDFGVVRDYRTKEVSEFYRLIVKSILPPLDESVRIKIWKPSCCSVCQKCEQNLESEIIYKADQLGAINDFNLTHEYFALGIPMQKLVVSKRVRDAFRKEKIRVLYYEPIRII